LKRLSTVMSASLGLVGVVIFGCNWHLLNDPSIASHMGPLVRALTFAQMGIGLAMGLGAVALANICTRCVYRPLQQLRAAVVQLSLGQSAVSFALPPEAAPELQGLAGDLKAVVADLRAADELARRDAELSRQAAEEQRRLSHQKDEFVSIVSHELRTPLAAIKSASSILTKERAGPLTPDQARFLAMIQDQTQRLNRLVDDLLDMRQLELGSMAYERNDQDLGLLLEDLADEFRHVAQSRGLELTVETPDEPIWARIDRHRLGQVFLNLLSNAAKFTPAGGRLALGAKVEGEVARLTLTDSGVGIAPEDLERIFHKFSQVESSLNRQVGGSGLGLAICRAIVEEGHGGRIWAESQPGRGSMFVVELPLPQRV
jgi:signal transduction histidine kinase